MEVRNAIPTLPPLDDPGERAGNPVVAWRWIAGSCKEREGEEQGSPHGTDSPPALRVQQDVWGEASVGARRLGYGDEWVFSPPEEGRRVRWIRILSGDSHRAKARCYDFGFPGVARLSRSIGASPDDETCGGGAGVRDRGRRHTKLAGVLHRAKARCYDFAYLGVARGFVASGLPPMTRRAGRVWGCGTGEARCEVRGRSSSSEGSMPRANSGFSGGVSSSEGSMLRFCLLGRSPPFSWHRGFPR